MIADTDSDAWIFKTELFKNRKQQTCLLYTSVAKKELLTDEQLLRCDTNDDNEVDIVDAMRVFYFVAKKIPSLKG